jgi:hypothetical protein
LRVGDRRVETVDSWPTLAAAVWEMACSAWEEPGNHLLSKPVEEATGQVAATAVFGPRLDLLVTASDGRRWQLPVPEFYRDHAGAGAPPG